MRAVLADWQIAQGNACPCRGADDMCACQNVNPANKAQADARTATHTALDAWLASTDPVERHAAFWRMIDLGREYQRGGTGG